MKISVFYDHILEAQEQSEMEILDSLKVCKAEGIEAVEINYSYFKEHEDFICDMLKQASMKISCFYQQFDWGKNPDITFAKEMVETAKKLKVSRILVIPGFLNEEDAAALLQCGNTYEGTSHYMSEHREILNMKKALLELTEFAQQYSVVITLEDFDDWHAPFARTWQLLWFLREVPKLGYTLDIGNFVYSDEDVRDACQQLGDYIVHVHCKDRGIESNKVQGIYQKGMAAVAVGAGYIPIDVLIKALKERHYEGYLAIEHFGEANQMAAIKQSAKFLKNYLG